MTARYSDPRLPSTQTVPVLTLNFQFPQNSPTVTARGGKWVRDMGCGMWELAEGVAQCKGLVLACGCTVASVRHSLTPSAWSLPTTGWLPFFTRFQACTSLPSSAAVTVTASEPLEGFRCNSADVRHKGRFAGTHAANSVRSTTGAAPLLPRCPSDLRRSITSSPTLHLCPRPHLMNRAVQSGARWCVAVGHSV